MNFLSVIYAVAALNLVIQVIFLFKQSLYSRKLTAWFCAFLALSLFASLIFRSIEIQFVALTGIFESLLFYAAVIFLLSAIYVLQKRFVSPPKFVFFTSAAALFLLLIAASPLVPHDAKPPVPILRSAWLLFHVSFSFIGYAFFTFAFIFAFFVLLSKNEQSRKLFDHLTYTSVLTGYVFFTSGALVFGAIWAESAWGRFWSWDPKETWAFITWLIYSLYLHARLYRKNQRRLTAFIAILGFLCTLFTFFGVNYLLGGLHSYR